MLSPNEKVNTREAYLYVIEIGDTGVYKVGITGDISKRIEALQTSNPAKLQERFLSSINSDGVRALELESSVHKMLADKRLSGEWFECGLAEIFAAIDASFVKLYYEQRKPKNRLKCSDLYFQSCAPITKPMATALRSILRSEERYRDLALFSVQVTTLLRPPEVLALRIQDVYDGERVILDSIRDRDGFIRSLDEPAKEAIELYFLGRSDLAPTDWLFPGRSHRQLSMKELEKIVEDWIFLLRRAGMKDLDPTNYNAHSVRKAKAFYIYQETGDLSACSILLNHTRRWHTACYLGVEALTGRHLGLLTPSSTHVTPRAA